MSEDNRLKQAQDLVKNYSFSFTHPAEVSRELQKFADAKSLAEQDKIFEKITNYGSVFKGKDTLRTALDQLFDKRQEMAVNKVTTAAREQTEINPNNHLEAAKSIVAEYSLLFESTQSLEEALKRFASTQSPQEKNTCFETIMRLGSVSSENSQLLRTALDQLFDKQQEMAVTAHPIQPKVVMPTAEPKPISNVPLNNNKINQSNKANTLDAEPVIVKINTQKYAVCVQDNEKYLVGLENQATNAMISTYNLRKGVKNIFSNSDLENIKKITVKDKSQDIFYGTITIGGKNIAGHVVGAVVYKDVNGQYKTTVLDQTIYIDPETGAERLDAKQEYRNLYAQQVRNIHSRIQNSYPNIQFDNNIDFQHGVYPVEGNLASCSEVMAYFTDDLIKENFNVNNALTHIKEEISLPRMASIRFKATCTAMQEIEMKFNAAGLERTPLNKLNPIRNNSIIDDMGFLRKLTDAEYTQLTGIEVPVKTTELSAPPLQSQIAEQQVHKLENLDTQLPTPALQDGVASIAKDVKSFITPPNAVTQRYPNNKTVKQVIDVIHALNDNNDLPEIMGEEKAKEFQATTKLMTEHCQKGNIKGVQQGFARLNELCADQPNIQTTSTGRNLLKVISSAALVIAAVIACKFDSVSARVQKFKESVRNLVKSDHKFSESLSKTRGFDTNNHSVNRMQNVSPGR